ncbi:MAG: hypothetical protein F6K54_05805 [Okeania sp. SIO3B5]|uniref:hypothetical protein n=1 Tax=Okeania sp. SIO3B5 TaxID=2607811 RepID=UPI00140038C9|nr:hypothetical protein [Okeania sp. SIO3B5]NEO52631.1 hypothetical protein [Okeania sp. SIO3B5]
MNLPVILDIAIGLIFIYLIFGVLASEIQSILTIILQWRATHLKKSIEELIAGDTHIGKNNSKSSIEIEKVQKLANSLYQNQLIKNLNYSGGKGPLEKGFRKIIQILGNLSRALTGINNIFDVEKTAPSAIPSDTFAASLIDTLKLQELMQMISEDKLRDFIDNILLNIKQILDKLKIEDSSQQKKIQAEFENLHQELNQNIQDYKNNLANLDLTLDRTLDKLDLYTKKSLELLPDKDSKEFNSQINLVKQVLKNPGERKVLVTKMEPSASNLLKFLREIMEMGKAAQTDLQNNKKEIHQKAIEMIELLPESLRKSLYILAKQATTKISETGNALHQFQKEIERWFDSGMERAAGVYKRNAKGVAFLIGVTIAIVANVDTLNMVDNLSKDSFMRATINSYSQKLINNNSNPNELEIGDIENQVNAALDDNLKLPIGWGQEQKNKTSVSQSITFLEGLKKILGWLISGIAISMGGHFWFNLLENIYSIKK